MKQHIIDYSPDRMKLVFILVVMFCDMYVLLIERLNTHSSIIIVSLYLL